MDDVISKGKAERRLFINLITGLVGIGFALALLLIVLRVQDFVALWFVKFLVFIFPFPIACGLFVGLISPRKAIAWAPLWSGIFTILLLTLLSNCIYEACGALSGIRIALIVAGGLLAALAGLGGQWAAEHSHVGKSVLGLILACLLLSWLGYTLFQNQMSVYKRDAMPQVLLELDRDYITLPRGMEWTCDRRIRDGGYAFTSILNSKRILVFANADEACVRYIEYDSPSARLNIKTKTDARKYLIRAGIRDAFLQGLVEIKGKPACWQSILRGSQITLWSDGRIKVSNIPIKQHVSRTTCVK